MVCWLSFLGDFQYSRFAWSVYIVNGDCVQIRYGRQWVMAFMMASNS
jgi:hypothetical protein